MNFSKKLFTCPLAFIFAVFQQCHGNGKKERAQSSNDFSMLQTYGYGMNVCANGMVCQQQGSQQLSIEQTVSIGFK